MKDDEIGSTPLIDAAAAGHWEAVAALLEHGADVHATRNDGRTALWMAAQNGHREAARRLLEAGARVDQADAKGQAPLQMVICLFGSLSKKDIYLLVPVPGVR